MRADQRAEFGPRIDQIQTHQVGIPQELRLPRGVRVSVGATRLFISVGLAVLSATAVEVAQRFLGNTLDITEAAEPNCRVGTRIESYVFFDMAQVLPEMGRRHIIDMGIDPRAGAGVGFTVDAVPVSYKAGDRKKPGYRPFDSTNIVRDAKNDVGRGELRFTAPCNTIAGTNEGRKVPVLRYKLVSSLDPDNDQVEVVTEDGRRSVVVFGREIKKAGDFLGIIDAGIQDVKDLDPKKKELIIRLAQTPTTTSTPSLTATSTRTGTATSTRSPSITATKTETPTPTATQTATATGTPTPVSPAKLEVKPEVKPETKPEVKPEVKPEAGTKPAPKPEDSPSPSAFDNVVSGAKRLGGDIADRVIEQTRIPRVVREGSYYFGEIRKFLGI